MNGNQPIEPPARLRRVLGLPRLTASAIGLIVGAGIYVLLGPVTAEAGAIVWLAFVLAALLSLLTGLSYAELSTMYPRAGGEFEFSRHAFPSPIAFVVGWMAASALMVAAGAVALGFSRYLRNFISIDERIGALGLLALVTTVALIGMEHASRVTVALSVVQVGGLVWVVAIGAPHIGDVDLLAGNGVSGVIAATALIFFAFIGFDDVVTLAEESKDPTKTVPRALLLGLGISTLLYVAVAIAAVSVLGADALGASSRPLADVVSKATGEQFGDVVAAIAMIATTNTTLIALTAASRVLYGMASSGHLPTPLARVSRRTRIPSTAILLVALVASGTALLNDLTLVASVTDAAVYIVFLAVNGAVIVLRFRQPNRPRPFRSPLAIGRVPILPVLAIASIGVVLPALTRGALVLGTAFVLLGLAVYAILRPTR